MKNKKLEEMLYLGLIFVTILVIGYFTLMRGNQLGFMFFGIIIMLFYQKIGIFEKIGGKENECKTNT